MEQLLVHVCHQRTESDHYHVDDLGDMHVARSKMNSVIHGQMFHRVSHSDMDKLPEMHVQFASMRQFSHSMSFRTIQ